MWEGRIAAAKAKVEAGATLNDRVTYRGLPVAMARYFREKYPQGAKVVALGRVIGAQNDLATLALNNEKEATVVLHGLANPQPGDVVLVTGTINSIVTGGDGVTRLVLRGVKPVDE